MAVSPVSFTNGCAGVSAEFVMFFGCVYAVLYVPSRQRGGCIRYLGALGGEHLDRSVQ